MLRWMVVVAAVGRLRGWTVLSRRWGFTRPQHHRMLTRIGGTSRRRMVDERTLAAERAVAAAAEITIRGERRPRQQVPGSVRKLVAYRQKYRCEECDVLLPPNYEIDHVVPVALNGSDDVSNLQALCRACHAQKTRDQRHEILNDKKKQKKKTAPAAALEEEARKKKKQPVTLNAEQHRAATSERRAVLCAAGPGTGKTRVLIERISHLMNARRVPPWQILAVTFTNRAAQELKERLPEPSPFAGTFHRVCLVALRNDVDRLNCGIRKGFGVYDQSAMIKLAGECVKRLGLDPKKYPSAGVQAWISATKNSLSNFDDDDDDTYRVVYEEYQRELIRRNAVDFDDMLLLAGRLFQEVPEIRRKYQRRWPHILVDEFQDTNKPQYEILKLLTNKNGSVFVVGDENQAIYGFRGADPANLQNFRRDFSPDDLDEITLRTNYRSSQSILDASAALVGHPALKAARGDHTRGQVPHVYVVPDQDSEARLIADITSRVSRKGTSVAVLYRTNAQSSFLERQLLDKGVKYALFRGKAFFERREVLDLLAYLKVVHSDLDESAFSRIVNVPPRGLGVQTLSTLDQIARQHGLTSLAYLYSNHTLTTIAPSRRKALAGFADLVQSLRDSLASAAASSLSPKFSAPAGVEADPPTRQEALKEGSVSWLLMEILEKTGYEDFLKKDLDSGGDRIRNVRELVNLAQPFGDDLEAFLDDCALVQDQDTRQDDAPRVHLLTVHAAKGLEYDFCIVAGCEDNLFPHFYAHNDDDPEAALDEERRLLYVAMTRAKSHLFLIQAQARLAWGVYRNAGPSRFVTDLLQQSDLSQHQSGVHLLLKSDDILNQHLLSSPSFSRSFSRRGGGHSSFSDHDDPDNLLDDFFESSSSSSRRRRKTRR